MESNSCRQEKKQSWCLRVLVLISVMLVEGVKPHVLSVESMQRLEMMCNFTSYQSKCYKTLSSVNSSDPQALFRASLVKAMEEHVVILGNPWKLNSSDQAVVGRLNVCEEMMVDSVEYLNETIEYFDEFKKALGQVEIHEMREKLSYVIVDHATCSESFDELEEVSFSSYQRNLEAIKNLRDSWQTGRELVSNSLAILTKILGGSRKEDDTSLLGHEETSFPYWFGDEEKSLFSCQLTPNVTVAKDGSGDYKTIGEAIASVPEKSSSRFVIYVKAGFYEEIVIVAKHKDNVLMYGDGNNKTVVSGRLNRVDNPNLGTYQTATFSVNANGFLVRDMKFENTAGPEKSQAVAFHSQSSRSVMYRCRIQGYQDTLYAHRGTQFYLECKIVGTVDFIFGAATAVFQQCDILPREPLRGQKDTVTAQAATREIISSFSIIKSSILPYEEEGTRVTAAVYLGRPWQNFSRVVVMRSLLGGLIHEQGWLAWNATSDPPPRTITYGEYKNYGPGSSVTNRVNWTGYTPVMTDQEANKYTVNALINQDGWLNQTCIFYCISFHCKNEFK